METKRHKENRKEDKRILLLDTGFPTVELGNSYLSDYCDIQFLEVDIGQMKKLYDQVYEECATANTVHVDGIFERLKVAQWYVKRRREKGEKGEEEGRRRKNRILISF
jgi:hypothetical protein